MENRFEHNPQEERQDWGAYVKPPSYLGQPNSNEMEAHVQNLCARVQEMLPSLLENDGEIRPEMAASIYAHLAVCLQCAQDFAEMQRIVSMVEALAPPEMPIDFSAIIMQRIEIEFSPVRSDIPIRPLRAVSSDVSGEAAAETRSERTQETQPTSVRTQQTEEKQTVATELENRQTQQSQTSLNVVQRLTGIGVLLGVVCFFLLTNWGREALGVNARETMTWLGGIGKAASDVPLLGAIVTLVASALTEVGSTLEKTYHNLGAMTTLGLTLDLAICTAGYYMLVARRQRRHIQNY